MPNHQILILQQFKNLYILFHSATQYMYVKLKKKLKIQIISRFHKIYKFSTLYRVSHNFMYKLEGQVQNIVRNHKCMGKHQRKLIDDSVCELSISMLGFLMVETECNLHHTDNNRHGTQQRTTQQFSRTIHLTMWTGRSQVSGFFFQKLLPEMLIMSSHTFDEEFFST